ncbi:hypothetical protein ACFVUF_10765, partial [Lysinibacillus sp. NPDC058154]|uniref:hypothetical protein n=1 Tax=Lysinibacillus sp. NPDC058154 TaxID=3346358 RepID=UPI0036D9BF81
VATATNVLSVRKRSDSNKCFICAKAKRQQQMFSVAKAKRQLQSAQPERKSISRYSNKSNDAKAQFFILRKRS